MSSKEGGNKAQCSQSPAKVPTDPKNNDEKVPLKASGGAVCLHTIRSQETAEERKKEMEGKKHDTNKSK